MTNFRAMMDGPYIYFISDDELLEPHQMAEQFNQVQAENERLRKALLHAANEAYKSESGHRIINEYYTREDWIKEQIEYWMLKGDE
jgi:hypothetical protein